jgi:hypothetical protein
VKDCAVSWCDRTAVARDYCRRHYHRLVRYGDPEGGKYYEGLPVVERILRRIVLTDTGCWEWQGYADVHGYGQMGLGNKVYLVHRLSYEAHVGPIPDGMMIDHLCRYPRCVNPAHLDVVTPRENLMRSDLTFAGRKARQTSCIHGHLFDEKNTWVSKDGRRKCRKCSARNQRARYHRLKEVAT